MHWLQAQLVWKILMLYGLFKWNLKYNSKDIVKALMDIVRAKVLGVYGDQDSGNPWIGGMAP